MNQKQKEEYIRKMQEEQQRLQKLRIVAARRAAERQQAIDEAPRLKYAVIVAVDEKGGFSKAGEIPWHFSQDLKWFKKQTKDQICVMGRTTYEDINKRMEEKEQKSADEEKTETTEIVEQTSVLPDRKCFVVSNTLTNVSNAVVVKSISEVHLHLTEDDIDNKTIFLIGGEQIYREGIALADAAYITVINNDYHCDKYFPTKYVLEHFEVEKQFKHKDTPECRFTIWKRRVDLHP